MPKIWKMPWRDYLEKVHENEKFTHLTDPEVYEIWLKTPYPERPYRRSAQYDIVNPFEFDVVEGERVVIPFPFVTQEDFPTDMVVQIYSLVDRTITMYDCTDSIEGNCLSTTVQNAGHYDAGIVIATCTLQKVEYWDNDGWNNSDFISRSHRKYTGYAEPLFNRIGDNSAFEIAQSRIFTPELPESNPLFGLEGGDR